MNLKQRIYRLLLNLRRRTYRLFCPIIACLIGTFGLNPSVNGATWYVDGSLQACGDGFGWPTAFRYLQDALNNPNLFQGDQIWVAAWTYYVDQDCANPDGSGDRDKTFQLVRRVFLLGGFNGTELDADERDPVLNLTILSGAIAQGQDPPGCAANMESCFQEPHSPGCLFEIDRECCERVCDPIDGDPLCCLPGGEWNQHCVELALERCGGSYHVVTAGSEIDDPEQTVIDGFTIRDGWANGDPLLDQHHGGGMFIQGEPSVVRCTFRQNTASVEGGGMTIKGDLKRPHIINAIFEENPGDPANPGDQQVFPINGGGLASIFQADPIFTNSLFVQNTAKLDGGAIFNSAGTCLANPTHGGSCGRITLINCTVAYNTAGPNSSGGGLFFGGTAGRLDAENTIVWGNIPSANQIDGALTAVFVNYSDCEGVCPGEGDGNINLNPLFVDVPGNLRLTILSECIDNGNPLESIIPCDFFDLNNNGETCLPAPEEATPDLDLHDRVLGIVDMGAYEFIGLCPCQDICPADLDGSCAVDVKDLLILLGAWGPNPGHPADFDDSGDVGVKDLLILLGLWGPCDCNPGPEVLSLDQELADACLTQADWDAFVNVMETGTEADKDNYLCWMKHYLNACSSCICAHPVGICPGPDPF